MITFVFHLFNYYTCITYIIQYVCVHLCISDSSWSVVAAQSVGDWPEKWRVLCSSLRQNIGILLVGEGDKYLQSTVEVPLSKVTNLKLLI